MKYLLIFLLVCGLKSTAQTKIYVNNPDWNCGHYGSRPAIISPDKRYITFDFKSNGFQYTMPYVVAMRFWKKEGTYIVGIKKLKPIP